MHHGRRREKRNLMPVLLALPRQLVLALLPCLSWIPTLRQLCMLTTARPVRTPLTTTLNVNLVAATFANRTSDARRLPSTERSSSPFHDCRNTRDHKLAGASDLVSPCFGFAEVAVTRYLGV